MALQTMRETSPQRERCLPHISSDDRKSVQGGKGSTRTRAAQCVSPPCPLLLLSLRCNWANTRTEAVQLPVPQHCASHSSATGQVFLWHYGRWQLAGKHSQHTCSRLSSSLQATKDPTHCPSPSHTHKRTHGEQVPRRDSWKVHSSHDIHAKSENCKNKKRNRVTHTTDNGHSLCPAECA